MGIDLYLFSVELPFLAQFRCGKLDGKSTKL